MNLSKPLRAFSKFLYRISIRISRLLPKQKCQTFGAANPKGSSSIEKIYVINLDRHPDRWSEIQRELAHVLGAKGTALTKLTMRFSAIDARNSVLSSPKDDEVNTFYTLGDQLFVEPQPNALPTRMELDRPIHMSRSEIAVARSHISVWRQIATGDQKYALVLEDDVWFRHCFARHLDQAWNEIEAFAEGTNRHDILYLSYEEVKNGAQKTFLSKNVFRPVRGLWHLSGYVLSREGAEKLLQLLPCRGPVDLWINQQFDVLEVLATRKSIITQRRDFVSSNSYSILSSLTKIGVIDSEDASLFPIRPQEQPVFAFGSEGTGLSSLATALSMLGYRCCSDVEELPKCEVEKLFSGAPDRVFDAYVNIGSLKGRMRELKKSYPQAKFVATVGKVEEITDNCSDSFDGLKKSDIAVLYTNEPNKWKIICEHLRCAPPICSYPEIVDIGQEQIRDFSFESSPFLKGVTLKRDRSPWVVEPRPGWRGIYSISGSRSPRTNGRKIAFNDYLYFLDSERWLLRDDTFTENLALFRPSNVEFRDCGGAVLSVRKESVGVRSYAAGSISSREQYLFGRFEVVIQASNVPGVVTGFFLHRDSPRQEIDVEIVGNRPDQLLVNVFYNPGDAGARFDYGYRGAPTRIDLGFDASKSAHLFAIEWGPCEIKWIVDGEIVHQRVNWDPTPIPNLPMGLHVNIWPCRSKELVGRLNKRGLPATVIVKSIAINSTQITN